MFADRIDVTIKHMPYICVVREEVQMMDISGLGILNAYKYTNQIQGEQTIPTAFDEVMNGISSSEDKVKSYKTSLEMKFGVPIMEVSVGKDEDSVERFAGGTSGRGNVVIAPNILEQMANDPEKAAYYEKKIQQYFNSLPRSSAIMASIRHTITAEGVIIHEDGTVTSYISGEESPETRAKFEAEQKAKREKKVAERREEEKRIQKAALERRHLENMRLQGLMSLESYVNSNSYFAFSDSTDGLISSYVAGLINRKVTI